MVRRWVPIVVFILFAVFIFSRSVQSESELKLVNVFHRLRIQSETYVLHYGSPLKLMSEREAIQFLRPFGEYFRLPLKVSHTIEQGTIYELLGKFHSFDIKLRLLLGGKAAHAPYFSLQVIGKGVFDNDLVTIKKQLVHFLRINKQKPHFHFSIQGYDKAISQKEIMKQALHLLHSKKVEEMKDQTVSVSAYSPVLGETIKTAGGEMNVQIATRQDVDRKRVLVTMGTPIITIEY